MRRGLTKFPPPSSSSSSIPNFISFTSSYSTSSSGRGRGRGFISPNFNFIKDDDSHHVSPSSPSSENNPSPPVLGHGHGAGGGGHGKPFPSTQVLPHSSSFDAKPGPGRGRGLGLGMGSSGSITPQPTQPPLAPPSDPTRKPPGIYDSQTASFLGRPRNPEETHLPASIMAVLKGGAGRGKIPNSPSLGPSDKPKEENRHIRARQPQEGREDVTVRQPQQQGREDVTVRQPQQERLSQEEAVKKAVGILSRGGDGVAAARGERGGGGPRGGRGRGLQGWRGGRGGRGRGRGEQGGRFSEDAGNDNDETGLYLGDDADGEKLAQRLGPDINNQLVEAFEDMSSRVLPSPVDDAYEDALRTNLMIECEPEYLMGDFGSNPDIDEKPPMSLKDALEKVKPFLMAYENIQTQQEWEVRICTLANNWTHPYSHGLAVNPYFEDMSIKT